MKSDSSLPLRALKCRINTLNLIPLCVLKFGIKTRDLVVVFSKGISSGEAVLLWWACVGVPWGSVGAASARGGLLRATPTPINTNGLIKLLFAPQSAAEYVKSRLPEVLKQHLQDYEKDKENSVLSYQTILEQQILSIDREMLEKLTVSYDEAGLALVLYHLHFTAKKPAPFGVSPNTMCRLNSCPRFCEIFLPPEVRLGWQMLLRSDGMPGS